MNSPELNKRLRQIQQDLGPIKRNLDIIFTFDSTASNLEKLMLLQLRDHINRADQYLINVISALEHDEILVKNINDRENLK